MTRPKPTETSRPRRVLLLPTVLLALASGAAWAQSPFTLGTVTVTAGRPATFELGVDQVASVISRQDMQTYNRDNVGDALNILSGITLSNNVRNEKTIFVRGFDVRQAPLFIDGIPVYVPYDGYVDLNRFTTADLAAIQVAKGFSSVTYGPNTLAGAINLVSRKPLKPLEGDIDLGFASGHEKHAAVNFATNQGQWYFQAGASTLSSEYFPMSGKFPGTATEDGGQRDNSYRQDSKVSLKLGFTPNATDDYALSYIKQEGEKGQPQSTIPGNARYWKWPYWNKESLYFISNTALGTQEAMKLRLYVDKFGNALDMYTRNYAAIANPRNDRSSYDDSTHGGSLELSSTRLPDQELKLVAHYKVDKHLARDGAAATTESFRDSLSSYAIEDNIQLSPALLLSLGLARHTLKPQEVYKLGSPFTLPNAKSTTNGQAGLFYDYSERARFYLTTAQKSRLPTLKDRYSARLATYSENPGLRQEETLNYEIGYQGRLWSSTSAEAALFYSDVADKIQTVYQPGSASCSAARKCQMQNLGKVRMQGLELGLNSPINAWLEMGANYTFLDMRNVSNPAMRLTDVPRNKLTTHLRLRPLAQLELVALVESASARWVSNTIQLGGYTTANLKARYQLDTQLSAEVGVNNLSDKHYALADGLPNPGRMWFANAHYQF